MTGIWQAQQVGDYSQMRRLLEELVQAEELDPTVRCIAASLFEHLGDRAQALTQLAIVLAIYPEHWMAHKRLAMMLYKDGKPHTADQVLQAGWRHKAKHFRGKRREEEQQIYFRIPGSADAPVA